MPQQSHSTERSVLFVGAYITEQHVHSTGEDMAERLRARGWRVGTTSSLSNRWLRAADTLWTIWRKRHEYEVAQVDVYSGRAFLAAEAACWLLRRLGKPYVFTLYGGNLPSFAQKHPGRVRRLLQSAHAVVAPSRYLQEKLSAFCEHIDVVPSPLEVGAFPARSRARARPRLAWVRAFAGYYNPSLAVEVAARLAEHRPGVRLYMVGPDKGDGSLARARAQAARCGVQEQVQFVGGVPREEVASWLERADVFVNTTNIDNFPVSVVEAMACGLCVVSTDVGGLEYMLEDDEEALLVPPRDADAMTAAVESILDDPALAESLSRRGHRRAETMSWEAVLPQYEGKLERAAASAYAPPG